MRQFFRFRWLVTALAVSLTVMGCKKGTEGDGVLTPPAEPLAAEEPTALETPGGENEANFYYQQQVELLQQLLLEAQQGGSTGATGGDDTVLKEFEKKVDTLKAEWAKQQQALADEVQALKESVESGETEGAVLEEVSDLQQDVEEMKGENAALKSELEEAKQDAQEYVDQKIEEEKTKKEEAAAVAEEVKTRGGDITLGDVVKEALPYSGNTTDKGPVRKALCPAESVVTGMTFVTGVAVDKVGYIHCQKVGPNGEMSVPQYDKDDPPAGTYGTADFSKYGLIGQIQMLAVHVGAGVDPGSLFRFSQPKGMEPYVGGSGGNQLTVIACPKEQALVGWKLKGYAYKDPKQFRAVAGGSEFYCKTVSNMNQGIAKQLTLTTSSMKPGTIQGAAQQCPEEGQILTGIGASAYHQGKSDGRLGGLSGDCSPVLGTALDVYNKTVVVHDDSIVFGAGLVAQTTKDAYGNIASAGSLLSYDFAAGSVGQSVKNSALANKKAFEFYADGNTASLTLTGEATPLVQHPGSCFMICPSAYVPVRYERKKHGYTLTYYSSTQNKNVTYDKWTCARLSPGAVATKEEKEAQLWCGGQQVTLQGSHEQKSPGEDPIHDSAERFNFLPIGGNAVTGETTTASCGMESVRQFTLAELAAGPKIARLWCGMSTTEDLTSLPPKSMDPTKAVYEKGYFGENQTWPQIFDTESQRMRCTSGLDLVGWGMFIEAPVVDPGQPMIAPTAHFVPLCRHHDTKFVE
ncbi:MAG: hypothetical protein HYV02_05310 [Deltaproteobacteria bacterium]|nr:hypothetical protein [Deltaproteobacteria bacterium]